jgi:hypothetical protein
MAIKYRIEYDDDAGTATQIDISDTAWSGGITTLTPASDPLIIHMPKADDTFTPVQGSGCTINVLGKDSDNLRSLYTADPQKYMVTIYKGGTASSDVVFVGWINTGVYTESYNEYDNYPLSFTANDGLNSLKHFKYLNSGAVYTGEDQVADVIERCIAATGLAYHHIAVNTSMYYDGYTIASNDTILQNLEVINANYYDEQWRAKTYKEVLTMIMEALGLIMFTQGAILYILDPLELDETSTAFKNFNTSTGAYIDTDAHSPVADLGTDCEWFQTGAQLDYKDGFSRVRVNYSGYAAENVFNNTSWDNKALHDSAGTWFLESPGASYGDDYYRNDTYGPIEGWTVLNGAYFSASRYDGREEFHCKWVRSTPEGPGDGLARLQFTGNAQTLRGTTDSKLRVTWGMHIQTADRGYYNPQKDMDVFYNSWFKVTLKVGNWYYNTDTSSWQTTPIDALLFNKGDRSNMNDKWFQFETIVDLPATVSGEVFIVFYDYSQLGSVKWYLLDSPDQRVIRIKDVKVDWSWNMETALLEFLHTEQDLSTTPQSGLLTSELQGCLHIRTCLRFS